jgi:hypothetical protein
MRTLSRWWTGLSPRRRVLLGAVALLVTAVGIVAGVRVPRGEPGPADTAALIDQLRADGIDLTYHPDDRTLRASGHHAPSVTIGNHTTSTHSRHNASEGGLEPGNR